MATFLLKHFHEIVIFVISMLNSIFLTTLKIKFLKNFFFEFPLGEGYGDRKPEGDFNKNEHAWFVARTDPSMTI